MTVSKRPKPMDFSGVDEDPFEVAARPEPQPRLEPVDPARPAHAAPALQGGRAPTARPETAAEIHEAVAAFDQHAPAGWPVWLVASAVAALWALGPIAYAIGYRNDVAPLQSDPFALAVFALLAIGPAAFVFGAAYVVRQAQKLAHEGRRAQAMAEDLLAPVLMAAARAGDVTHAVREEILRAGAAADEARETLTALRDALAFETEKLTGVTAQSVRTANELAVTLGRERTEMGALAQTLDAQAGKIADAIGQQARMVTEAAGVAEAQLRDAEGTLSARAADLVAAAGEASSAARTAGEDLTRHIARLELAGGGVADQIRAVESGLGEQRTALVTLTQALKGDHEAFAVQAELHAQSLREFIEGARVSADEMRERAMAGGETLRRLMADAALQFRDLAETARAEREEFGQSTLQALEAVSAAAADQRAGLEAQARAAIDALAAAAEDTRAAAARHAATAREQVDQLSEAAFSAGQKANQVFEARLEEAKALVEQSSKMVEDAGATTARKLAEGAASARAALDELAALMADIEQRAARLPEAARGQAEQVRSAVADGMEELRAQARRTAEEARAIDEGFQDRVKRNFEMLSEAVRLMGVAAVAPTSAAPGPGEPAPARATPQPEADAPEPADVPALRNRIRLTPTATDREFSEVFRAAAGQPPPETEEPPEGGEPWTWKDLLASLDGEEGEGERLQDLLAAEISAMGVDPEKLLPAPRLEEVAAALQTGDAEGAREVVRKLAPAASRRIARRLFTDDAVKRRAEIFVRRYRTLMADAAARDPQGFVLAELLGEPGGRIYLLLDAAAGDML